MGLVRRGLSGNIKFDSQNDQVMIKDTFRNLWKNWQKTTLIVLPSTITVTTTTLNTMPVTCQIGEESYTTTFIDGKAVFKVFSEGTALITCNGYTASVSVSQNGHFTAVIEEIVQLTIWENGTAKNGAVLVNNTRLDYDCMLTGAFANKKLNIMYSSATACQPYVGFVDGVNGNNLGAMCFLKKDGGLAVATDSTNDTHTIGEIYSYKIADMAAKIGQNINNLHAFFFHVKNTSGTGVAISGYVSKIWIE